LTIWLSSGGGPGGLVRFAPGHGALLNAHWGFALHGLACESAPSF